MGSNLDSVTGHSPYEMIKNWHLIVAWVWRSEKCLWNSCIIAMLYRFCYRNTSKNIFLSKLTLWCWQCHPWTVSQLLKNSCVLEVTMHLSAVQGSSVWDKMRKLLRNFLSGFPYSSLHSSLLGTPNVLHSQQPQLRSFPHVSRQNSPPQSVSYSFWIFPVRGHSYFLLSAPPNENGNNLLRTVTRSEQ